MFTPIGSSAASLGSALGQGLARPIQDALSMLTQQKMQDIQSRKMEEYQAGERKRLADVYEQIYPGLGNLISSLPEKAQLAFMANYQQPGQEPASEDLGTLSNLMPEQLPAQPFQQAAQPSAFDKLMQLQGAQAQPGLGFLANIPQEQQPVQQLQAQPQQATLKRELPVAENLGNRISQALQESRISPSERIKINQKERQLAQAEKTAALNETRKLREEIYQKAQAARQNLHDLDEMESLQETGKLDTPGYVEFLNRSGLDIPSLMNPESQEFQKIAYNFMRDAKSVFGSRISNMEIENFLKTIPSLSQSNSGRSRVIANLKYISRAHLAYNDAMKEVIKENKGVPPDDLNTQIDDKIDKKLEAISKKFKKDLSKPVPQEQPRLTTALQAIAGSLIGGPGQLAKSAAGLALHLL